MAKKITLELDIKTDLRQLKDLQQQTQALAASLEEDYTNCLERAMDATRSWVGAATREVEGLFSGWGRIITSGLEEAFSSAIRGDLEKAEGILESFGQRLEEGFRSLGERLAVGLVEELVGGLERLAQRFVFAPLEGLLTGALGKLTSSIGEWLGGIGGLPGSGSGGLISSLAGSLLGRKTLEVLPGLGGALEAAGGAAGGEWAGINAEIQAAQGSAGAISAGALGAIGAGLGMWGGLELFSSITDIPGPTQSLGEALGQILGFGGEEGYSPMQALAELNARMELFIRQIQQLGTLDLSAAGELARNLEMLAERAGMGSQGLEDLVNSLGPLEGKLVEAAQAMGQVGTKIDQLVGEAQRLEAEMSSTVSGADMLRQRLVEMAGAMGLPEAEAKQLRNAIEELVDAWQRGDMSAEALAEALRSRFAGALEHLAHSAGTTVSQMRALAEAIRSIPTHWESEVGVRVHTIGSLPSGGGGGLVMHSGGLVPPWPRYHHGALVGGLGADELPAVLRRGEFVVRAESVGPLTLPWLEALNRSGRVPETGPAVVINAPLVEVHGHALAGEEGIEELARIIEEKLSEFAETRVRGYP